MQGGRGEEIACAGIESGMWKRGRECLCARYKQIVPCSSTVCASRVPSVTGAAGPHRQGAATGPRCAPGPVAAPCLPLRCPRATRPPSSPQRPAALPAGSRARARRFRPTSAFPAPLSREFAPPHARLAGSPGRFARVPSAISVTARPYQSAAGAHR